MRIGIDARFYGSLGKGLGRYTERLIESLEELDTPHEFFVFLRRENFDEYQPKSSRFRKVLADYEWYGFSEQFLFPWLLMRYQLALVHFPHFNVPILYPGRFVVTIHDLILLRYPTIRNTTRFAPWYWVKFILYRLVIRTACFRAESVITVSRFTESDLLQEFPFLSGKTRVTLEGANRSCERVPAEEERNILRRYDLIRETSSSSSRHDIIQPYFLYVGNAYPHKNLESIGEMAARFPEHRFVLVGREDYFYERLKDAFAQPNLLFTGFLSDAEISVLYRHGLAYVFPSLYEGFGLPPLEAMSYGLPVIASDRGSLPEVLGKAALFFDPLRTDEFADRLSVIAHDPLLRDRLVKAGYQRMKIFSWQRMAQGTVAAYERATE